ncbi:MAG: hypothetical protein GXO79_11480 [Chlorobi bacterium]|nr:hypothetical protein [Chlorobiota bacterium]
MKKQNKIVLGISLILLMLIGLGIYFSVQQSAFGSGSYLSISKVSVTNGGNQLLIYGTTNGAENLKIYFRESTINSLLEKQGYKINKVPSSLEISMNNPSRDFSVSKNNNQIFYKIGTFDLSTWKSCQNNMPTKAAHSLGRLGITAYVFGSRTCAYVYPVGVFSTFTGLQTDNNYVTFKLNNKLIGTLNPSSGENVVRSSDGKTEIQWVGNLLNFQQVTKPSNYALLFSSSYFNKIIKYSSWSDYKDELQNIGINYDTLKLNGFLANIGFTDSDINNFNNKMNSILVSQKTNYENSVNANSEFISNGLRVYPSTPNTFPTFKIYLSADSVQLERLSGKPRIVTPCSQSTSVIKSGDYLNVKFKVENVGSQKGAFYGSVSCTGNSNIADIGIPQKTVNAGSTKTFTTQMSAINKKSGTDTNNCKIKIIDLNSQKSDSCSFNLGVKYQPNVICSPSSVKCTDVNTLKTCSSDGTKYDSVVTCDNGCETLESGVGQCKVSPKECTSDLDCSSSQTCDTSINKCVSKPDVCSAWITAPQFLGGKTILPDIGCIINKWFMKARTLFAVLLGFISFLSSFLLMKDIIKKKKDKWIAPVTGVVLGVILGMLAYTLFYWTIAALILLFLIKKAIPYIKK